MNLLIDVGNTRTKACCFSKDTGLGPIQEISSIDTSTKFESLVVTKVTNQNTLDIIKHFSYQNLIEAEVTPSAFGIECGYPNFSNLGVDRWIGILGAEKLLPKQNIIVVDSGTATTVDFLTATKRHLGGWILPGLELMQTSIVSKAPKVFSGPTELEEVIGTDTPSALRNGCLSAQQATIIKACNDFKLHIGCADIKIVVTGGAAKSISENLNVEHVLEPMLLFHGLSRFC